MAMRSWIVLALATSAISAPSQVSSQEGDQGRLLQIEQQWVDAIQHHDTRFLDQLLAKDFVDTPADGHLRTKHDALTSPVAQDVESEKLQDLAVHLHGDTAVVTGVNIITGKARSYVATVHFTDVFHKVDGTWKAIAAQENVSVAHP